MANGGVDRRGFLRLTGLAALGAACTRGGGTALPSPAATSPDPAHSSPTPSPVPEPAELAWRRLDTAASPPARRDHTLTADASGARVYLFGGRSGGTPLGDLWVLDRAAGTWTALDANGPAPRFGHNAVFLEGRLVVFGGQGGPDAFFNDVWVLDPDVPRWARLPAAGGSPRERYGAGGTLIGSAFTISHGFTNSGRFDDTWTLSLATREWSEISPAPSSRPLKRCLHRIAAVPDDDRFVLFGGQANGEPFLGDTWLFDADRNRWIERAVPGPSPRNLYAMGTAGASVVLFGGITEGGVADDLWSFDGEGWTELRPAGEAPAARGGIEGAMAGPARMVVFGGIGADAELGDTWELTIP